MNKTRLSFILCLLIVVLLVLFSYRESLKDIQVFQQALEQSDLNTEKKIIDITLDNLKLESLKGKGNLESKILFADVMGNPDKELLVALNPDKHRGLLVVYSKKVSKYVLTASLDKLAPVDDIAFVSLPGLKNQALVLEEFFDEMLGAFYQVKTKSVYAFIDNKPTKLWEREVYRKEYFPEGYQLKGSDTQWLMKEDQVTVNFTEKGDIEVSGKETLSKAKIKGELQGEFILLSTQKIKEHYRWIKETKSFKRMFVLDFE